MRKIDLVINFNTNLRISIFKVKFHKTLTNLKKHNTNSKFKIYLNLKWKYIMVKSKNNRKILLNANNICLYKGNNC